MSLHVLQHPSLEGPSGHYPSSAGGSNTSQGRCHPSSHGLDVQDSGGRGPAVARRMLTIPYTAHCQTGSPATRPPTPSQASPPGLVWLWWVQHNRAAWGRSPQTAPCVLWWGSAQQLPAAPPRPFAGSDHPPVSPLFSPQDKILLGNPGNPIPGYLALGLCLHRGMQEKGMFCNPDSLPGHCHTSPVPLATFQLPGPAGACPSPPSGMGAGGSSGQGTCHQHAQLLLPPPWP